MKKVIILTGSELRHQFVRKFIALSDDIKVLRTYSEGDEKSLKNFALSQENNTYRLRHMLNREQSEKDFFKLFVDCSPDYSNPVFIKRGDVNLPEHISEIIELNPDLVIAYGCSLVKDPLIKAFSGRFLNVHLGLSPYVRGSGSNYWPFVNNEPEYAGATFMYIDVGVDTGEIIHQIRPKIVWGDTLSIIGNRLIIEVAHTYCEIIKKFDRLEKMPQIPVPKNERYYRKKDYTEESVIALYNNFKNGLVENYLGQEAARCKKVPIIKNPALA